MAASGNNTVWNGVNRGAFILLPFRRVTARAEGSRNLCTRDGIIIYTRVQVYTYERGTATCVWCETALDFGFLPREQERKKKKGGKKKPRTKKK